MVENRRPSRPRRKKEGDSRQRDKGKRKPEDSLSWSSKGNRFKKYPGVRMAIISITFNSNSSSNHNRLPHSNNSNSNSRLLDSNSFNSHSRQPLSLLSNKDVPIILIPGEDSHNSKVNSSNSPDSSNSISNSNSNSFRLNSNSFSPSNKCNNKMSNNNRTSSHNNNRVSNNRISLNRDSSLRGSQLRLICGILPRLKPRF